MQASDLFLWGKPEWTPSCGHGRVLQTADCGLSPHSAYLLPLFVKKKKLPLKIHKKKMDALSFPGYV